MSFAVALRAATSRAAKGRGASAMRTLRRGAGKTVEGAQVAAAGLAAGGSNQGALAALLIAQTQAPTDGSLLVSAAVPLVQLGHAREALAFLDRAQQLGHLGPNLFGLNAKAIAQNNRGFALIALGRPHDAELALRKAVALEPELTEADQNLAVALMCEGKRAPARSPQSWRAPREVRLHPVAGRVHLWRRRASHTAARVSGVRPKRRQGADAAADHLSVSTQRPRQRDGPLEGAQRQALRPEHGAPLPPRSARDDLGVTRWAPAVDQRAA
jgi:tetratricopeptide (TPR) repeat protein